MSTPANRCRGIQSSRASRTNSTASATPGVFCEIPCAPCDETNGQCTFDGVNAVCRCRADVANDATSASAVFHQRFGEDTTGFGFAGAVVRDAV